MSGRPNGPRAKRRGISPLELIDYRLAFGTDGRGAMAVHKNLAAKWLRDGRSIAHLLAGGPPPRSTQAPEPRRRLLPENATEIDDRAYRAIGLAVIAARARAKPDDASLVFTDLQLGAEEFLKLFRERPAKDAGRRPISEHDMREMLLAEANKDPLKVFGVRDAQTLLDKTRRPYDRDLMRTIMRNLSGRGPGRPRKVK